MTFTVLFIKNKQQLNKFQNSLLELYAIRISHVYAHYLWCNAIRISNIEFQKFQMNNAIYADTGQNLSNAMARVYPCSFSWKLVYEIKFDAPIRSHHVCKETWTLQKDGILHCKKEVFDIDKHAVDINKEDRLVGHAFMTGDPMDYVSRGNLSWPRLNIFRKANVIKWEISFCGEQWVDQQFHASQWFFATS